MEITIYTKIGCIYCQKIKDWMKEKELTYYEIDILKVDDSVLLEEIKGVPYTTIEIQNKKLTILGFDQKKLNEVLS